MRTLLVCFALLATVGAGRADAALIGQFTFDNGTGTDSVGGWPTFNNHGATFTDGALQVAGTGNGGNTASKWADFSGYTGGNITNKTLVSWLRFDDKGVVSGSPIGISRPTADFFDSVVWAERQPLRWVAGSSGFQRTQDFVPGQDDSAGASVLRQIAITYSGSTVSGCLNGVSLGSYSDPDVPATFTAGDRIILGPRHFNGSASNTTGSLSARIAESRIYNDATTFPACGTPLGTVALSGTTISYTSPDQPTNLIVTTSGGNVTLDDTSGPLAAGAGCSATAGNVTCPATGNTLTINAGSGDDVIDASGASIPMIINGGAGPDTLTGGSGSDRLFGGAGNDTLVGGTGNDRMRGDAGADTLTGGLGLDRVLYDTSPGPVVSITASSLSDGLGSTDTVSAESITGSAQDDSLSGFRTLFGGAGNDTLVGTADDDFFSGVDGRDTYDGGTGGSDRVTHTANAANQGVSVSLGQTDASTDGRGATTEDYTSIEVVFGGAGDDQMTNNTTSGVEFHGRDGADFLWNIDGAASMLFGEGGSDQLRCQDGDRFSSEVDPTASNQVFACTDGAQYNPNGTHTPIG